MKNQLNVLNVFNSHHTSNDASSSEIKSIKLCEKIQILRKHIEKTKKVIHMWYNKKFEK